MPLGTLTYNANIREHVNAADVLGSMQGRILAGTLTRTTSHAYYAGHELRSNGVSWAGIYLKGDVPGTGRTLRGRTQNRVIVAVTAQGVLVEDWAVFWRHDNRLLTLSTGFFTRGRTWRNYYFTPPPVAA